MGARRWSSFRLCPSPEAASRLYGLDRAPTQAPSSVSESQAMDKVLDTLRCRENLRSGIRGGDLVVSERESSSRYNSSSSHVIRVSPRCRANRGCRGCRATRCRPDLLPETSHVSSGDGRACCSSSVGPAGRGSSPRRGRRSRSEGKAMATRAHQKGAHREARPYAVARQLRASPALRHNIDGCITMIASATLAFMCLASTGGASCLVPNFDRHLHV